MYFLSDCTPFCFVTGIFDGFLMIQDLIPKTASSSISITGDDFNLICPVPFSVIV